ncbi:MAG: tetratricopeptide repeat protein, partial [Actinomycetota bacterium]
TEARAAVATFRRLGERWILGATLGELGRVHQTLGNLDEAEACYVESLELVSDADYHGSHFVYSELGRLASDRGEHRLAADYHAEALRLAEMDGNVDCVASAVAGLAHAAEAKGDTELAIRHYRDAVDSGGTVPLWKHGPEEWRHALDRLTGDVSGSSARTDAPSVD